MRYNELIFERIINLHKDDNKDKYGDEVWAILQQSYVKAGGFKSASSLEELKNKTGLWKMIIRDDKITAVDLYKDQFGNKSIAIGCDGTSSGKADVMTLLKDNIKYGRSWSEVSGVIEHLMHKLGAPKIPACFAQYLIKKNILSIDADGYHYTRLIDGHPHTKIMCGTAKITPYEKEELESMGADFTKWPT